MGKQKVDTTELRRDVQSRRDTFHKRCRGLFKKGNDLSTLTGCGVLISMEAEDGRFYSLHRRRSSLYHHNNNNNNNTHTNQLMISPSSSSTSCKRRMFYNPSATGGKIEDTGVPPLPHEIHLLNSPHCSCYDCQRGFSTNKADALPPLLTLPSPNSSISPLLPHQHPMPHHRHSFISSPSNYLSSAIITPSHPHNNSASSQPPPHITNSHHNNLQLPISVSTDQSFRRSGNRLWTLPSNNSSSSSIRDIDHYHSSSNSTVNTEFERFNFEDDLLSLPYMEALNQQVGCIAEAETPSLKNEFDQSLIYHDMFGESQKYN